MRRLFTIGLLLLASMPAFGAQPGSITIRSLKVLAVIYRGAPGETGRLSDQDVQYTKNGIEYGRLFYFRNSQCRLNLDITYLVADRSAPSDEGGTYDNIVADLRTRGVKDNQYDGMFCTGVNFHGNLGGFKVFDKTGACFGIGGKGGDFVWAPENDPETFYDTSWIIVHEFQHALDSPICEDSGHPEMLSDHPYSDSAQGYVTPGHHAAQHWDWVAHTLTTFKDYLDVKGATDSTITAIDADGDGFPDDDPRLAMDEKRFGSDSTKKDTDADGLNDLREFSADIFRGSNPRKTDTDGDGITDGKDKYPTVAIAGTMAYSDAEPKVDGKLDNNYKPFTTGMYVDNSPALGASRMYACWNEDALYLFVKSKAQCSLDVQLDTSASDGFWQGGDTYYFLAKPDGTVVNPEKGKLIETAKSAWGTDGLEIKIPVLLGPGMMTEIYYKGKKLLPDTTDGMVLSSGRDISFNLILSAGNDRALITPNWTMFDITPTKSPSDPPRPSLRFTKKLTRDAKPTVVVTGIGSNDTVTIVDESGSTVGEGVGSGKIKLTGKLKVGNDAKTGANVLKARSAGRESAPITLVVDTEAQTPTIKHSGDMQTLTVTGEPNGRVEFFASDKQPITTVFLDKDGTGTVKMPMDGRGFVGAYGIGKEWNKPLFYRIDPEIKFDYQDGPPDPKVQSDIFCIRWTGVLDVSTTGDYTFYLATDDGSKLWIDSKQIIEHWGVHGYEEPKTATVKLEKGLHPVRVDYYEENGWAGAHLEWSGPGIERTHSLPIFLPLATDGHPTMLFKQTDAAGNVSKPAK